MLLFHGTFKENYKEINKCGYIDNFKISHATKTLDDLIQEFTGEISRLGATYLTDDISYVKNNYDANFELDTKNLNTDLLVITNRTLINNIFTEYNNENKEGLEIAIYEYLNSMIDYKDFIKREKKIRKEYKDIDYLYFDEIKI